MSGSWPVALVILTTGCDLIAVECTTDFRPALIVEVVDSLTDAPLLEPVVRVTDGAFEETLEVHQGVAHGAGERPGTYDVRVQHEGYADWLRDDVRVTEDECHVRTREMTARMVALEAASSPSSRDP